MPDMNNIRTEELLRSFWKNRKGFILFTPKQGEALLEAINQMAEEMFHVEGIQRPQRVMIEFGEGWTIKVTALSEWSRSKNYSYSIEYKRVID